MVDQEFHPRLSWSVEGFSSRQFGLVWSVVAFPGAFGRPGVMPEIFCCIREVPWSTGGPPRKGSRPRVVSVDNLGRVGVMFEDFSVAFEDVLVMFVGVSVMFEDVSVVVEDILVGWKTSPEC